MNSGNLPAPDFFDPGRTADVWIERGEQVAQAAVEYRRRYAVSPAVEDRERIAVFGVDAQVGFVTPGASLAVPGAVDDVNRAVSFIYRNLDRITNLQFSLDTHRVFQIFHPAFWVDTEGNHPAPFTPVSTDDIRSGRWRAIQNPRLAFEYCEALEKAGKKTLFIWPYHTLLGGVSHALVPALQEAAMFHAIVRYSPTHYEAKGSHTMTENYSVLEPEVKQIGTTAVGEFNAAFFDLLLNYDRIYIWGEASSHCVAETLWSLERRMRDTDPALLGKLYVLEDCMSPVPQAPGGPDFPAMARDALEGFRAAGMNLVRSTDAIA